MAKSAPRSGSMQFWPRKRAKKIYARIRTWVKGDKAKPLGFLGYKVGMTHFMAIQENKNSHLKGEEISVPATIIECPPIKILSARFYKQNTDGLYIEKEIFFKTDKFLPRKIKSGKENSKELDTINPENYKDIKITIYTQPNKAGFGKKKPEIVEIGLGGTNSEIITYIKENINKEIPFESVFEENKLVDINAITKGKGFQGPMKRFGIGLRRHKSEKSIRNPGSLGPWVRQQHISWRVAHAGQTGFHQRIEHHKQILKISNEPETAGKDFHKYGNIKSTYVVLHGSIPGSKKRPIILSAPRRGKNQLHKITLK